MKLKRFCAGLVALCMMGAVVPVLPVQESAVISANAEGEDVEYTEGTYENLKYEKYADYVEISGVTDKKITEAVIPAEIDGFPVTNIGYNAFAYCSNLTSVVIPDSVIGIKSGAFRFCSELTSITIPDSVVSIWRCAFSNCPNLTITVSENNTAYIVEDDILFNKDKTSLVWYSLKKAEKEYTIPNSVISIEAGAFARCSNLTSITIPESVINIGDESFNGCSNLTSIIIPDNVTSIGAMAFDNCSSLTSITIPESVNKIGYSAFSTCENLDSIIIKNPDCNIDEHGDGDTFSNRWNNETKKREFTGTLYGYEGSTAQAYAEKYGYQFALIGSEPKTEELKQGDADGNGEIDILDVITINKAIMGKENLSENGLKAIDFNGNGKPDSSEALTLLKYIVGLITDFHA